MYCSSFSTSFKVLAIVLGSFFLYSSAHAVGVVREKCKTVIRAVPTSGGRGEEPADKKQKVETTIRVRAPRLGYAVGE